MENFSFATLQKEIARLYDEDTQPVLPHYLYELPSKTVTWQLQFKTPMLVAGMPIFQDCIRYFDDQFQLGDELSNLEGQYLDGAKKFHFKAPFHIMLTAERIALNLLHRACAIATQTYHFKKLLSGHNIDLLDTRKTTPGLRWLEKYAVYIGGGRNHRYSQTDIFMIKDNHKKFFGSLTQAFNFFSKRAGFYQPIVAEIHSVNELHEAYELGIGYLLLDNFTPAQLKEIVKSKRVGVTFEVSGGIRQENIQDYLIEGIDAISTSAITQWPAPVDISLKLEQVL